MHCFIIFFGFLQSHGNIAKWLKKEGDKVGFILYLDDNPVYDIECGILVTDLNFGSFWQVEVGDVLCEIETDKATVELESQEEG